VGLKNACALGKQRVLMAMMFNIAGCVCLSRNDSFEIGSATVSVALAGVSPASHTPVARSPFGGVSPGTDVFGETPKTAVETTALPRATESFRLSR
jgi:hypothetical protein